MRGHGHGTHNRPFPLGSNKMENRQHRSGNFPRQLPVEMDTKLQRVFGRFQCIMNIPECAKWNPNSCEMGIMSWRRRVPKIISYAKLGGGRLRELSTQSQPPTWPTTRHMGPASGHEQFAFGTLARIGY